MKHIGSVTDKTLTPYLLIKDLRTNKMFASFPFYKGWDSWDIEAIPKEEWLLNPDINKFPY